MVFFYVLNVLWVGNARIEKSPVYDYEWFLVILSLRASWAIALTSFCRPPAERKSRWIHSLW